MIEHRWEIEARLEEGMTEGRIDGGALRLVTVCLCDEGAGEISDAEGRPVAPGAPVVSYVRPVEGRDLAFCLLARAELAERVTEPGDEPV
jgi:hypothetical protein